MRYKRFRVQGLGFKGLGFKYGLVGDGPYVVQCTHHRHPKNSHSTCGALPALAGEDQRTEILVLQAKFSGVRREVLHKAQSLEPGPKLKQGRIAA